MKLSAMVLALITATLVIGCARMEVSQSVDEMTAKMDPLVGQSREEVVLALGAPLEIMTVGELEVFKYHQSFGIRGQAMMAPNPYLTSGSGRSWEAYDSINVYFKDGTMVNWDGYVQR